MLDAQMEAFAGAAEGVEAVLQRAGAGTFDLVLIDAAGNWERAVVPTEAIARSFCEDRGIPMHVGWDDPALAKRVNSLDAWATPGAKRRAL